LFVLSAGSAIQAVGLEWKSEIFIPVLLLFCEKQERPSALATDAPGIEVVRHGKRRRFLACHIRHDSRVRHTNASRRVPVTVHLSVRRVRNVQTCEAGPLSEARVPNEIRVFSGVRLHRSMTPNSFLSPEKLVCKSSLCIRTAVHERLRGRFPVTSRGPSFALRRSCSASRRAAHHCG
jgi:hypothetical protein